eukprot:COSAG05_NODE_6320_length_981_cov_1.443311_1_plen_327_part_11
MVGSLALSCLAMATLVSDGPGVFLGLFAIRLFAKSAELPFKTQVNYHWQHARGRAMAVISLFGDSLGSKILVPLLLNTFTAGTGWQAGYTALAVTVVLCGGLGVCLAKEREDCKDEAVETAAAHPSAPHQASYLSADGEEALEDASQDGTETGPLVLTPAAAVWTRARVLRSPTFWVYALALASTYMLEMGWMYEVREVVVAMMPDKFSVAGGGDGVTNVAATSATTGVNMVIFIRGVCSCGGTALGGLMYDRYGARFCVVVAQLCQVLSMALMGCPRPSVLWAITVLAGLQNGIVTNVGSVVFADYFGLGIAGSIQGVVQMIGMAG